MTVERMKQLELEGIASSLETPEEDAGQISDAARGRFEALVARTLEAPNSPKGDGEEALTLPSPEGEGESGWFAQYLDLAKAGFKWRVAAYIAWASSPKINRWPKTQAMFAKEILGLTSDRVIIEWRQKNSSIDSTIGQLQSQPLFEHRADIFDALIQSASNANYKNHQDRKLALEILGDYSPKIKVEDGREKGKGEDDYSSLSDEELQRRIAMAEALKDRELDSEKPEDWSSHEFEADEEAPDELDNSEGDTE
jgi:hypothetical protein